MRDFLRVRFLAEVSELKRYGEIDLLAFVDEQDEFALGVHS